MTLPNLKTPKERLQWAASSAGCHDAAELHRKVGGVAVTVRSHYNGTRPTSLRAARLYGAKLGVSWRWLAMIDDEGKPSEPTPTPVPEPRPEPGPEELSRIAATLVIARELAKVGVTDPADQATFISNVLDLVAPGRFR